MAVFVLVCESMSAPMTMQLASDVSEQLPDVFSANC